MEGWGGYGYEPETSDAAPRSETPKPNGMEPGCGDTDEGRQRSIAKSLKRIADALDDVVRSGAQINVDLRPS